MSSTNTNKNFEEDCGNFGPDSSAHAIIFHQAVANKLGINPSDYRCILLLLSGPKAPSQLAEAASLTPGALTAVVDRLEKAGYVVRKADSNDRRRLLIYAQAKARHEVMPFFASLSQATKELESRYTLQELRAIYDYLMRVGDVLHSETAKIRTSRTKG